MATTALTVLESLPLDPQFYKGTYYHRTPMNISSHSSVINAQQYGLNAAYSSHSPSMSTMTANPTQSGSGPLPVTGKRARKPSEDDVTGDAYTAGEKERKKRSRGRPRLDTKDETAADRRRTQIRLAQRAYRHRKDTTITTLEQRVKELERANNDMSRGFNDFYDLLLSERALEKVPHVVHRLSMIADRITTAADGAKTSNGESSGSEESDEHLISNTRNHPNLPSVQSATPAVPSIPPSNRFCPDSAQRMNMHGTCIATSEMPVTTVVTTSGPMMHMPTSLDYEVVTAATPENASFPFYSSMEPTAEDDFNGNLATGHSPYSSVAPPLSYASNEMTFGRRLQRHTIENGLRLILMSNPPPDRFAAVFGFCLFFESKESIIKRLQLALSRNQHEDLSNWRVPFTNLGGAGTHFPPQQPSGRTDNTSTAMPIGNQGTRSYGRLQETTGQSMGPFGPEVQATRDERIDHKMQMMWPGFEGEFLDPDEVETYLRRIGIFIPQHAEYVEAEIDINDLDREEPFLRRASSSSTPVISGQNPAFKHPDSGYGGSNYGGTWTANSNSPVSAVTDASGFQVALNVAQQSELPIRGHQYGNEAAEYGSGMGSFMLPPAATRIWSQPMTWAVKCKIGLNVPLLIKGRSHRLRRS
ncbi:bZIP family transcription factor [Metarhizium rileyi]|uniref:BZIP family transcription factor n=1 Tax=Metarhizium rileyi (strain RCEF 4871) TaxID=1649241 RepID=A0A167KDL7_METRR|nr:bZIP family transcription factor [Metarhizium rileyi RCEF 4871]